MRGPRLRPAHWRARAIAGRRLCLQRLGGRSNDSLSITLTRAIDTAETVQWVQLILQCACYLMRYNTPLLQLRAWRMGFERCQTSHSQTELLGRIISAKRVRGQTCTSERSVTACACRQQPVLREDFAPFNFDVAHAVMLAKFTRFVRLARLPDTYLNLMNMPDQMH